jgi:hypothetical protein
MTAEDNNLLELRIINGLSREKGSTEKSANYGPEGINLHDFFIG